MYFKHDISDICRKKKSHKTATSKKDGNKYTFEYVNKKLQLQKITYQYYNKRCTSQNLQIFPNKISFFRVQKNLK